MTREINLIPEEYVARLTQRRDVRIAAIIVGTCVTALVILSYLLVCAVGERRREVEQQRDQALTLRSLRAELIALASEKEALLGEMSRLGRFFCCSQWPAALSAVAHAPETILLTALEAMAPSPVGRLSVSRTASDAGLRHLTLSGLSLSGDDLSEFVTGLKNSAGFTTVDISFTRREGFHGLDAMRFELDCVIEPPPRDEGGDG
ncbi:MAG: PilN domain-containing protein [Candidatus Eisenbacteria bacterium]|nr:PilN domain-containing protein [Candidatus Eisenbacteria bacterium]